MIMGLQLDIDKLTARSKELDRMVASCGIKGWAKRFVVSNKLAEEILNFMFLTEVEEDNA